MKVVHVDRENEPLKFSECMEKAKEFELNNNIDEAIKMYLKCIRLNPASEFAYNRLFILYRKSKQYNKELAVIKQGIRFFEELFAKQKKVKSSNRITRLSNALMKSTGLADKKGKPIYEQQPILKWKQRALLIEKRLRKEGQKN
jgi:tetratricopeptide (TPR) repeat protein